jgi:hypothetical protein
MAIRGITENLQKVEFDVTTAEGPSHVTIVTGSVSGIVTAQSQGTQDEVQSGSVEALLDPQLAPGQFRKAVATASISNFGLGQAPTVATKAQWSIDQVEATWDAGSGQIELRIDARVIDSGKGAITQTFAYNFQVTTLSKL